MPQQWTPVQSRILNLLSDGFLHRKEEVFSECLQDTFLNDNALNNHISTLRKKLRPMGEDILCKVQQDGVFFHHVRIVSIAE